MGHRLVYAYVDHATVVPALAPAVTAVALSRRAMPAQVRDLVARHEIDVGYATMNEYDGSIEVLVELLDAGVAGVDLPVVRHYKEHSCAPSHAERRTLLETDGQIYINEESLDYFRRAYAVPGWSAHVMDADPIAARYMTDDLSPKLRHEDGEAHLLVAGNLSTWHDRQDMRPFCEEMSRRGVHTHLYGNYIGRTAEGLHVSGYAPARRAYERMAAALPRVHLHDYVPRDLFAREWSRYDAGVLHARADPGAPYARFEPMNLPYRHSAYLAAGLPLAVQRGGQDAMERLAREAGVGLVFDGYDDLAAQLGDERHLAGLTERALRERHSFSFDAQAPRLAEILGAYTR